MAFFGFFNFLQKHMYLSTTNKKLKFYHQNLTFTKQIPSMIKKNLISYLKQYTHKL